MNRETSLPTRIVAILTRALKIPVWILAIVVLALPIASMLRIEISNTLLGLIIFLLIVVGWFLAGYQPTQMELSDPEAPPGHPIRLSRIPKSARPELLPINRDDLMDETQYRRDGVPELLFISGNLVFRDSNEKLVTTFSSSIRVTLKYTKADEDAALERQTKLINSNVLPPDGKVEIIPVYLYSYPTDAETPEFSIWKPFQDFTRDETNRTLTVEVQFWGDRQIGGGTQP